jgi:hypothetical protein
MEHRVAYSPSQAAAASGIPVDQIVAAAMSGSLRSHVAGGNVVILRADLESFIARLPSLPAVTAEAREADARAAAAAAYARGKAIATKALAPRPVEPGHARGKALATKLLGKDRK